MKLGDAISTIAQPIARNIDAIWGSDLAGCSGCNKMRDNLNAGMSMQDAIIERWFKKKEKGEKMQFQILIVVEAESVEEALQNKSNATTISINPRPQQPQRPANVPTGVQTNIRTVAQPT